MLIKSLGAAIGLSALTFSASAAHAVGVSDISKTLHRAGTIVQRVHSLGKAEQSLYGLGYYDVRVERATLPYSFSACKRGKRYHIHIDYYGTLVQVDRIGSCEDYADAPNYYGRRSHYDRYRYRPDDY